MTAPVEALFERYQVDRDHARYVADLALALFDGSEKLHNLPTRARELLEIGALLHNVGLHIDERKHHTVGRDVVLNSAIDGLDDDERSIVACLVSFHRKKVQPESESAFLRLEKKQQATALSLAAIVRVADGLDSSQSQTTTVAAFELDGDALQVTVQGPHAAEDSTRALEKANLWKKVFGAPLAISVASDLQTASAEDQQHDDLELVHANGTPLVEHSANGTPLVALDGTPLAATAVPHQAPWKVVPDDTLAEAARKLLRRYFQKLLSQEADIRASDDPEGVHQMRVATRRLRATLQALGPALNQEMAQRFRRQIRAIASELGTVRDHDVFLEHIQHYSEGPDAVPIEQLALLTDTLTKERDAAKKRLMRKLDGRDYNRFKRRFASFVTSSSEEAADHELGPVPRVRYAAGSAIWQAYEQLRAYETLVPIQQQLDPDRDMVHLHEMRIAGKHFRYTLELFSEALGPRVEEVLTPLVNMQEYLGSLQDIEVASAYVKQLTATHKHQDALATYIESRHADRDKLLDELPARWAKVAGATYRRRLMEAVLKL